LRLAVGVFLGVVLLSLAAVLPDEGVVGCSLFSAAFVLFMVAVVLMSFLFSTPQVFCAVLSVLNFPLVWKRWMSISGAPDFRESMAATRTGR
jgi:uncharacterized membrane protein YkgB